MSHLNTDRAVDLAEVDTFNTAVAHVLAQAEAGRWPMRDPRAVSIVPASGCRHHLPVHGPAAANMPTADRSCLRRRATRVAQHADSPAFAGAHR